jgi:hypothetical protein
MVGRALEAGAWRRLTVGAGAKGPRRFEWARVPINHPYDPRRWQRHMTLAMVALALLVLTRARLFARPASGPPTMAAFKKSRGLGPAVATGCPRRSTSAARCGSTAAGLGAGVWATQGARGNAGEGDGVR